MANIIVVFILLAIFSLSIYKIVSEKRKGVKCVGCASSGGCSAKKNPRNRAVRDQIAVKQLL